MINLNSYLFEKLKVDKKNGLTLSDHDRLVFDEIKELVLKFLTKENYHIDEDDIFIQQGKYGIIQVAITGYELYYKEDKVPTLTRLMQQVEDYLISKGIKLDQKIYHSMKPNGRDIIGFYIQPK